jgi:hypothetical protein
VRDGPPDRRNFATSVDQTDAGKVIRRHFEESVVSYHARKANGVVGSGQSISIWPERQSTVAWAAGRRRARQPVLQAARRPRIVLRY